MWRKLLIGGLALLLLVALFSKREVELESVVFAPDVIALASATLPTSHDYPLPTQQPFRYLGHGSQSIVFESADGKVVLKFFLLKQLQKTNTFHRVSLLKSLPWVADYLERNKLKHRQKRATETMENYAQIFLDLREETALLALHFSPTEGLYGEVTLIDQLGKEHRVDLDKRAFIVQERVKIVGEVIHALSYDERLAALQALETLLESRARKGYYDERGGFLIERNYGFHEGRAILLDPGRNLFSKEQQAHPEAEIQHMHAHLFDWFSKLAP